MVIRKVNTGKN